MNQRLRDFQCVSFGSSESVVSGSFAQYAGSTQINLAHRNGSHGNRLFFVNEVNMIIWIRKNQQLQRNSVKYSDSRTNSKCKSPYAGAHCVKIIYISVWRISSHPLNFLIFPVTYMVLDFIEHLDI